MRILQRLVLKDLVIVFTGVASTLTVLLVVVGIVGEATKNGLGPVQILQILPYIIPSLLPYTIPATFLLTVCVVYGRMSGDQEITAMKSAGINILEILWPAFILGAVLSLGTLMLTDQFVPWSRAKIESIITTAMEDIFLDILRAHNKFHDPVKGLAVTVRRVEGRRLLDPTFRYMLPGGQTALVAAKEATLKFDLQKQQVLLDLVQGQVEIPGGTTFKFEHEQRPFPLPMQTNEKTAPRNISIQNIRRELADLEVDTQRLKQRRVITTALWLATGSFEELGFEKQRSVEQKLVDQEERQHKLTTEIHSRVALACSCFFFSIVGSPFAIQQGKRQFLTTFALCFVPILLLYYPAVLLTMNLSREGIVHPLWAMWLGNAGMGVAAAVVLRKVLRH
ncbi:MAG: LptF/LptG family permease [Planctomycetales bacterium]